MQAAQHVRNITSAIATLPHRESVRGFGRTVWEHSQRTGEGHAWNAHDAQPNTPCIHGASVAAQRQPACTRALTSLPCTLSLLRRRSRCSSRHTTRRTRRWAGRTLEDIEVEEGGALCVACVCVYIYRFRLPRFPPLGRSGPTCSSTSRWRTVNWRPSHAASQRYPPVRGAGAGCRAAAAAAAAQLLLRSCCCCRRRRCCCCCCSRLGCVWRRPAGGMAAVPSAVRATSPLLRIHAGRPLLPAVDPPHTHAPLRVSLCSQACHCSHAGH